jgi:Sugar transferases involved in lipopolysaccharide synthesis
MLPLTTMLSSQSGRSFPHPCGSAQQPNFAAYQRWLKRLLVRPGLTGWAQIHGRNAVECNRRLAFDADYVEKLRRPGGLLLDLRILWKTAALVFVQAISGKKPGLLRNVFQRAVSARLRPLLWEERTWPANVCCWSTGTRLTGKSCTR